MSLTAQKQLAKGYEARDMQYGARREVVQLETIELQEPPEKRMNCKSESSYPIRDKAYPLSLGGIGKALRLLSAIVGGKPGLNRDRVHWGKKSLRLKHHQFAVRDGTSLPISRLGARGARGGAASTGHDGMDLCRVRSDEGSPREDGVIWI